MELDKRILPDNAEEVRNVELEEDIKHCKEVLADWHGCNECKADHERLLSYMKELLEYRKYYADYSKIMKLKTSTENGILSGLGNKKIKDVEFKI